jgi:hypothetical protein
VPNPTEVIDGQVDAYRDRDLERFLSFYADDATILDPAGRPIMVGLAELRKQYGESFRANPTLSIEIAKRITVGDYVIDEEHLTGLGDPGGPDSLTAVAIYQVTDGKIRQVMLLR